MKHFYNTIDLSPKELHVAILKAKRQEDKVKVVFDSFKTDLTPFEVLNLGGFECPITSIRRAITNLTNQGYLKQTGEKRQGEYGKPNWTWIKS